MEESLMKAATYPSLQQVGAFLGKRTRVCSLNGEFFINTEMYYRNWKIKEKFVRRQNRVQSGTVSGILKSSVISNVESSATRCSVVSPEFGSEVRCLLLLVIGCRVVDVRVVLLNGTRPRVRHPHSPVIVIVPEGNCRRLAVSLLAAASPVVIRRCLGSLQ